MSAVRATALRAGGACVRCRKGKTKCVYENGRAPCKNCSKGMHECYLPSESMSHGGHGVSPARATHRVREALPSERASSGAAGDPRHGPAHSTAIASRSAAPANEKYVFIFICHCHYHCHRPWIVSTDPCFVCLLLFFAAVSASPFPSVSISHHHRNQLRPSPSCFLHLTHLGSHLSSPAAPSQRDPCFSRAFITSLRAVC